MLGRTVHFRADPKVLVSSPLQEGSQNLREAHRQRLPQTDCCEDGYICEVDEWITGQHLCPAK